MGYRLVADAAMLAHFSFLAYLVVGGFLAWRWPRTIWVHVPVALYGFLIVRIGWPCPLTQVESWGRARAGDAPLPPTGFIDHYVTGVLYPREHESSVLRLVVVVVLASWAGVIARRSRPDARPRRRPVDRT
jgi:hypothetical protein